MTGLALQIHSTFLHVIRRTSMVAAIGMASAMLTPDIASAQGLFDFLFGGGPPQKQQRQSSPASNFFADPFGFNTPAAPPPPTRPMQSAGGSGPAFCVRTCDGKYFPMSRSNASSVQMCQAFCPASPTKVFMGSTIDTAATSAGERYPDMDNAYAYRKALRADCTCNGRDPAGLAPVDLSLDTSLRPGDVVATTDGLVAFSGVRTGNSQTADFTPVASYPGLTPDVRARLGEMKVAPVSADMIADEAPMPETRDTLPLPAVTAVPPKSTTPAARGKRADLN